MLCSDLELRKREFVGEAKSHPGMLHHVPEAEVSCFILRRVNLLICVLHLRLHDECRWVSKFAGGGVIRAGIAAFCQNIRHIAVL